MCCVPYPALMFYEPQAVWTWPGYPRPVQSPDLVSLGSVQTCDRPVSDLSGPVQVYDTCT